jgi:hypothetical protein
MIVRAYYLSGGEVISPGSFFSLLKKDYIAL